MNNAGVLNEQDLGANPEARRVLELLTRHGVATDVVIESLLPEMDSTRVRAILGLLRETGWVEIHDTGDRGPRAITPTEAGVRLVRRFKRR